jgi:integrase
MHDRYYAIYYRMGKKVKWEGIGWSTQGATVEDAVKELANVMSALKSGAEVVTRSERRRRALEEYENNVKQKVTLSEFWDTKYHPHIKISSTPAAYAVAMSHFRAWLLPLLGDVPIACINGEHYEKLLNALVKAGRSKQTGIYVYCNLRQLLTYAENNGHEIKRIPSAKQAGFTAAVDNRRRRVITPVEAGSILTELRNRDINVYFLTKFAFLSGCRFSEAAKLRWQDVGEKTLVFAKTKNGAARKVLITEEMRKLFDEVKLYSNGKEGIVFADSSGCEHTRVPFCFKKVVKELKLNENRDKLDRLTFHSIRHTVASKLAPMLDLRSLMDTLGWKKVEMAGRYIHSDDSRIIKATETLGELFSGGDEVKKK